MRIIYVTAVLPYSTGEAYVLTEVNALVRLGHEVLVVPRSPRGSLVNAKDLLGESLAEPLMSARVMRRAAKVFLASPRRVSRAAGCILGSGSLRIRLKNAAVLPKALWLADVAARWRADHIHCHWAGTTASMTLVASRLSGIPWSLTAHRWDIVENNLLGAKAKNARFLRVISQETRKMAKRLGVEDNEKLRVLPMGVEIPAIVSRQAPQTPVLLCPANLVEVKGHRYLLRAWRILRDRGVAGELWIAGSGELKQSIEAQIRELDLAGSVKMLGALPHKELLRLYETNAITAVVLASLDLGNGLHEGIPVALIEAMSYGIPVISTRTGAIPELVIPETGLLVPPEDADALANAIGMVIENVQFAEQIGYAGQRRASEAHNIRTIAEALEGSFRANCARETPVLV